MLLLAVGASYASPGVRWRRPAIFAGHVWRLCALSLAFASHTIFATDRHWTGAPNPTWGTSINWDIAVPGSTDNAVFDGTFSNQPNVGVAAIVGGLWMTGSVGQNVTLSGTTLTLQGNTINGTSGLGILIDNANAYTLTINAPLKLGAAQTWRNNSANLFTIGAGGVNTNGFGLTIDGTGSTSISGVVSGSGTLTKASSGTLTLSGANTYTGATMINAGVLNIQNAAALGTTAGGTTVGTGAALQIQNNIAVGSEALTLNGSGISNTGALRNTIGSNSISGAVTLGSAATIGSDAGTLTLSGNITNGGFLLTTAGAGNLTLSGVISGMGGLTINSSGTVTLSGSSANTFSGATTVNSGILALNKTAATNAIAGSLTIGDNVSAAGTATVRDLLANELNGATSLTVNSSGVLDLNGLNDKINGNVTLYSGTNAGASITSGIGTFQSTGTITLAVSGTGANGATISGNLVDGGSTRTIYVNDGAADADLTISAVMQGKWGYIKDGAGTLVLSGANTFDASKAAGGSPDMTINAGAVEITNAAALGSTSYSTVVSSGAALELAGSIAFNAEPLTLNGSGVGGTGALLNVSGTNTFGGPLTIGSATTFGSNSGTLTLSDNFTNAGFLLTMTGAGDLSFSGVISGAGGITKTGTGNLILSGLNTFTGATILSTGVESVATINNGGVASNFGKASNAASNLVFDGGTLQYTGAAASTDRNFTINTGKTATFDVTTNTLTLAGASTATNGALTKIGAGTLVLTGTNLYTGATNINAGTLKEGAANVISDSSAVTVATSATYDLNGYNETIGSVAGAGTVTSSVAGPLTLTAGAANTSTLFSGVIQNGSGTISLTKSGTGTLTLSGTNTYTGPTTVNAGSLFVNGSTAAASAFTVNNSGTTVGGSGTINGSVNLASSGSNLSPGATGVGSLSILNTGSVTLSLGSNFNVDINGTTAGSGYDQLNVAGTFSIAGSNLVVTAGSNLSLGQTFYIVLNDGTDAVTGTFAQGSTVIASNGDQFLINYFANGDGGSVANDISLTVSALPEANTYLAGIVALAILSYHERQKFRRAIRTTIAFVFCRQQ